MRFNCEDHSSADSIVTTSPSDLSVVLKVLIGLERLYYDFSQNLQFRPSVSIVQRSAEFESLRWLPQIAISIFILTKSGLFKP